MGSRCFQGRGDVTVIWRPDPEALAVPVSQAQRAARGMEISQVPLEAKLIDRVPLKTLVFIWSCLADGQLAFSSDLCSPVAPSCVCPPFRVMSPMALGQSPDSIAGGTRLTMTWALPRSPPRPTFCESQSNFKSNFASADSEDRWPKFKSHSCALLSKPPKLSSSAKRTQEMTIAPAAWD